MSKDTWLQLQRAGHRAASLAEKSKPGWKLKNWRLQNALTQEEAAELLGCSQPALSQYELGERKPEGAIAESIRYRTGVRWT